jgi:hypothetical protein
MPRKEPLLGPGWTDFKVSSLKQTQPHRLDDQFPVELCVLEREAAGNTTGVAHGRNNIAANGY